ncbi:MAG: hypothetical protein P8P30_02335 [Rickettsiales bacterium]|nr:hypothetical protein [Rickettsiales bacterium]
MSKDAKIEGYYGGRGQGKSTGVKARIAKESRVIVYDPMKEYHRERGFKAARSLNDVRKLMIAGRGMTYKIAYQPASQNHYQALHELCQYLFFAQQPYHQNKSKRQMVLVVEEMNLSAPSHNLPVNQRGFSQAVLQGRHYGINIIGVTQRPKTIAPIFRDNADVENVYKLSCPDSVAYIEKKIRDPKYKDAIFALKPHEYLIIESFAVKRGKNKLSR